MYENLPTTHNQPSTDSDMKALNITDLKKTYKNGIEALEGVSFSVEAGDFFALLGLNGAGKSTIIGILTSLVNKTQGKVSIYGHDIDHNFSAAKACIGVVPQEFNFNIFEKVGNIILSQAGYYGIPRRLALQRAEHYLRQLALWDKRFTQSRALSGGMKRRLMIVRALIHEPKMLILDEPTAGVDIELRRSMWDFLIKLNQSGVTIILTTHYLEEAEQLCRNIAIINKGRIVANTAMADLLNQLDSEHFILYLSKPISYLPNVQGYRFWKIDQNIIEVEVPRTLGLSDLFEALSFEKISVSSMRNKTNRLEELFLRLTAEKMTV